MGREGRGRSTYLPPFLTILVTGLVSAVVSEFQIIRDKRQIAVFLSVICYQLQLQLQLFFVFWSRNPAPGNSVGNTVVRAHCRIHALLLGHLPRPQH